MARHPHFILALLLSNAAIALGVVTNAWTFPVLIVFALLLHLLFGLHMESKPDLLRKVALGIPFAIWFRLLSRNGVHEGFTRMVQVDVLFMVGFYALTYSLYHLLCVPVAPQSRGILRAPDDTPPPAGARGAEVLARSQLYRAEALGAAIVAVALAGVLPKSAIVADSHLSRLLVGLTITFVMLMFIELRRTHGLLYARNKPFHLAKQGLAAILVFLLAIVVQDYFVLRVPQISRTLTRKLLSNPSSASASFRKVTTLGSVSFNNNDATANEVVVTMWSDTPFPYLRGGVNDTYSDGQWSAIQENNTASRVDERDGRIVYALKPTTGDIPYAGTIYAVQENRESPFHKDTLFLPLGTARVSAFADKLFYSSAYTAQVPGSNSAGGYGFYEPGIAKDESREGAETNFTPEDLQIPAPLRAPLKKIAIESMSPNESPGRNAVLLQRWFEKNYTYATRIQLETQKDPILEFLEDRKAGHCEYFASAATLLFRSMNIPARFVTGYVAMERGLNDTCYIARRKDAHAWVEVYAPESGWKTVEVTPPDGIPAPLKPGLWDQIREYTFGTVERLFRVLQFGGLRAVLSNIWNGIAFVAEAVPLWGWIAIAVIGLIWSQRTRLNKIARRSKQLALTARARAIQRELERAEKRLARHGIRRPPAMPVGHFLAVVQRAELPEPLRRESLEAIRHYLAERFRA